MPPRHLATELWKVVDNNYTRYGEAWSSCQVALTEWCAAWRVIPLREAWKDKNGLQILDWHFETSAFYHYLSVLSDVADRNRQPGHWLCSHKYTRSHYRLFQAMTIEP